MIVYIREDKQFKKLANDFNCEEGVYSETISPEDYNIWDYVSDEEVIEELRKKGVDVEVYENDSEWLSELCGDKIELH